jgi:hypothetical protein
VVLPTSPHKLQVKRRLKTGKMEERLWLHTMDALPIIYDTKKQKDELQSVWYQGKV